jgi:hypothetical protein
VRQQYSKVNIMQILGTHVYNCYIVLQYLLLESESSKSQFCFILDIPTKERYLTSWNLVSLVIA